MFGLVRKVSIWLGIGAGLIQAADAQQLELGVGVGPTHYKGDIYPRFKPLAPSVGGNAFFRYNFSRALSVKIQAAGGEIAANDRLVSDNFHQKRGFSFSTTFVEMGGQLEYNFFDFRSRNSPHQYDYTPYLVGGFAITNFMKRSYKVSESVAYRFVPYHTNLEQAFGKTLLLGVGVKKILSKRFNVGVEFGVRKLFSDTILDNLGFVAKTPEIEGALNMGELPERISNFPESSYRSGTTPNVLLERKMATPLTQTNDNYYYTSFSISYVFGSTSCPMPQPTLWDRLRGYGRR